MVTEEYYLFRRSEAVRLNRFCQENFGRLTSLLSGEELSVGRGERSKTVARAVDLAAEAREPTQHGDHTSYLCSLVRPQPKPRWPFHRVRWVTIPSIFFIRGQIHPDVAREMIGVDLKSYMNPWTMDTNMGDLPGPPILWHHVEPHFFFQLFG